jgi:DNA-binding response OmpR family regulator/HPt (histidine-containing phosphotransfer) domain-containing protein
MAKKQDNSSQPELDNPTVLITDDDEATRLLLRAAITPWGYKVVEAKDGEDAWSILQQQDPPQILVLDWLMPRLDGIGLCQRIQEKLNYHPYIIFLTRMAGTENVIQGLEAGADEFILKPVDLAELRIRIFAGERIIKYRNQLVEQNKLLKDYLSQNNVLATERADLVIRLQDIHDEFVEIAKEFSDSEEKNIMQAQRIRTMQEKLNSVISILRSIQSDTKLLQASTLKKVASNKMAPAAEIKQEISTSVIDMNRMEAFFGTDLSAIKDFIKTFISLSQTQLSEIDKAVQNQDKEKGKYFFHLLGGAAANTGIKKMYELCVEAEQKIVVPDWDAAQKCYLGLKELVEKMQEELKVL